MNEIVKVYKNSPVRIVEKGGEPWFVAKDVCDILALGNPRSSIALLDEDERDVHSMDTSFKGTSIHDAISVPTSVPIASVTC